MEKASAGVMRRRDFIKCALAAALLTGLRVRQAQAAEMGYDPKRAFALPPGGPVPPDEMRLLAGYIAAFTLPEGDLPKAGGWTAVYDMIQISMGNKIKPGKPPMTNSIFGRVALSKPSDAPDYGVRMVATPTPAVEQVDATLHCNADAVASLRDYNLNWRCEAQNNSAVNYTLRESGRVDKGRWVVTSGAISDGMEIGTRLTAQPVLFDAVRHLPATGDWREDFNMLADFSSLRRNQSLRFSGRATLDTAGGPLAVRFYEQLGEGVPPIHYAVDDRDRTLFVTQGQLGWGLAEIGKSTSS